jgi:hypothetical protein
MHGLSAPISTTTAKLLQTGLYLSATKEAPSKDHHIVRLTRKFHYGTTTAGVNLKRSREPGTAGAQPKPMRQSTRELGTAGVLPRRPSGADRKGESHLAGIAETVKTGARDGAGSLVGRLLPHRGENLLLRHLPPPHAPITQVMIASNFLIRRECITVT